MNKYKMAEKAVVDWDIEDVARWLDNNRLSDYKQLFCDKHKIDGSVLISLTEDDLRKPPVEITVLGKYYGYPMLEVGHFFLLGKENFFLTLYLFSENIQTP